MRDPRFDSPLELEYIDGHNWRVTAAFNYHTDVHPLVVVRIPAGFITDFASIPRGLWNLFPPTGGYGKAAVVHDFLYRTVGPWTRRNADDVFREAMEYLGVGWWTRNTLYRGVRLFGGHSWRGVD